MKIPRSAAYLVLVVLLAAGAYMVYISDGIMGWRIPDQAVDQDNDEDVEETIFENDPEEWDFSRGEAFFIEYRLERERVRSRELDVLQQMINNPNVTESSKSEAEKKLLQLQETMELELLVENAIKAQGFANAILIMQKDGALIVVDGPELTSQQIMLIADLVSRSTGLRASQVNISNPVGK